MNIRCELAHGSPPCTIADFTNMEELYTKIAKCYRISKQDILFCTVGIHKVDMARLLRRPPKAGEFIFAHLKGPTRKIKITKFRDGTGVAFTHCHAGGAIIKEIVREGSIFSMTSSIEVGDYIEMINHESMIRHSPSEVLKKLRETPVGATFIISIVKPRKWGDEDSQSNNHPSNFNMEKNNQAGRFFIQEGITDSYTEEEFDSGEDDLSDNDSLDETPPLMSATNHRIEDIESDSSLFREPPDHTNQQKAGELQMQAAEGYRQPLNVQSSDDLSSHMLDTLKRIESRLDSLDVREAQILVFVNKVMEKVDRLEAQCQRIERACGQLQAQCSWLIGQSANGDFV